MRIEYGSEQLAREPVCLEIGPRLYYACMHSLKENKFEQYEESQPLEATESNQGGGQANQGVESARKQSTGHT